MPTVELDFTNATNAQVDTKRLAAHLETILRRLGQIGTVVIEVSIVKDPAIQQLNHKFLQKNQPTDVLSFENPDFTGNNNLPLGSLVISADTAAKQATEAGITLQEELEMLAGHGLLHLLGFNHN